MIVLNCRKSNVCNPSTKTKTRRESKMGWISRSSLFWIHILYLFADMSWWHTHFHSNSKTRIILPNFPNTTVSFSLVTADWGPVAKCLCWDRILIHIGFQRCREQVQCLANKNGVIAWHDLEQQARRVHKNLCSPCLGLCLWKACFGWKIKI